MPRIDMMAEDLNLNILLGDLNIKVVSLARVHPGKDWYVSKHSHHDYEFHIIPQGRGRVRLGDREFDVRGGEFYVTGPHVTHEQFTDPKDPMGEYCLECEINRAGGLSASYSSSSQETGVMGDVLRRCYPHPFRDTGGAAFLFERLFDELESRPAGYFVKAQALIVGIVVELFRAVSAAAGADVSYAVPSKSVTERRIERLAYFVSTNYRESITVSDAASALFLSPRQIDRLMRAGFGRTFHGYLSDFRIAVAKRLLTETDLAIDAVAVEAGFSSNLYMYQVFKRNGLPAPARYRAGSQTG